MPYESILQEVDQLNSVSERLESLATQYPLVENALVTISGSIRNAATLLKVLIAVKRL